MLTYLALLMVLLPGAAASLAQQPSSSAQAGSAAPAVPIERRDPDLDLASNLIGQALFLRCFCADDTLVFTASGAPEVKAKVKTVDWTLAGVNIIKVERRSPTEIELEGVRVAVRYAPDRHEWDRHPQKTEAMRLTVQDTGDPAAFRRALAAIFSVGIDRALQRSTPLYWQHYFDSQTPWPPDSLTGVTLYALGKPDAAGRTVTPPVAAHKAEPDYTIAAQRDHVQGTLQLQFAVTAAGAAERVSILQPLGYGLDASAAESIAKYRFSPATLDGAPVAASLSLQQEFKLVP